MNHRDNINPHHKVTRKEFRVKEDLSDKKKVNEEVIMALLKPLDEAGNLTKYYYPKPDVIKVFLKGGSSLVVHTKTGEAVYERLERRPLLFRWLSSISIRGNGGHGLPIFLPFVLCSLP